MMVMLGVDVHDAIDMMLSFVCRMGGILKKGGISPLFLVLVVREYVLNKKYYT
jgi:hypothetical protein